MNSAVAGIATKHQTSVPSPTATEGLGEPGEGGEGGVGIQAWDVVARAATYEQYASQHWGTSHA